MYAIRSYYANNVLSVAANYAIPLTASSTEWASAYNTVSNNSADWDWAYATVNASSSLWDIAYLWDDHFV